MTDNEFLDDLEARLRDPWSDDDTLRLWKMGKYRTPPADVRAAYSQQSWRRQELINEVRTEMADRVIKRLEQE